MNLKARNRIRREKEGMIERNWRNGRMAMGEGRRAKGEGQGEWERWRVGEKESGYKKRLK